MKNNTTYTLCLVLATMTTLMAQAGVRTPEDAALLAARTLSADIQGAPRRAVRANELQLTATVSKTNRQEAALYVFNRQNGGAAIVSADDRAVDVLAYTEDGTFDMENANPTFRWWIERLRGEISAIPDEDHEAYSPARTATNTTPISPLLGNTAWDQETPYWNQCPMDLWKTSERCLTGCVATATGQIMRFWQWPEVGTGSHSYTWECCMNKGCTRTQSQPLSMDFTTQQFDWANMLDTYTQGAYNTTQANAVAKLMYALGIACDMQYGGNTIGGSGAWTDDMGHAIETYFSYKPAVFITTYTKEDYEGRDGKGVACSMPNSQCRWGLTKTAIRDSIILELQASRPVLMGGEDWRDGGGHEFVCDGCDSSSRLHINWGWSGDSNCYTAITALQPAQTSHSFSDAIDALIHFEPAYPITEVKTLREEKSARKVLRDGQICIIIGDREVNILGY